MRRFAAMSILVTALVAACGGGSSTIARAEYVRRADAICKKYNDKTKSMKAPTSEAELEPFIHQGVQLVLASLRELRDLPKPDADAGKFSKLYDDVESRYKSLDSKSAAELHKLPSSYTDDLNARSTALGLKECGGTPS